MDVHGLCVGVFVKEISYINIKQLSLLESNPRKITKAQFQKLCKSLEDDSSFFDCRPCLVNHITDTGKMLVYAGNQRLQAAKKLGWKEVPCIVDENLSEEVMKARIVKDNAHYGEFDWDILGNEYDFDVLLDCGLLEKDLIGKFEEISVVEEKEKKKKEDKLKMCPSCGHEF